METEHQPTDDRRTLTVRVDDTEGIRSAALDAIEAATDGEDPAPMHALGLGSDAELARLVSETNLELLRTIATEEPESIRDLARRVERDYSEVHRNLGELEELNVIELEDTGYRKRPRVRYDALEVQVRLREPAGHSEDADREAATAD
jgi:predicted transcriptional regulator